MVFAEMATSGVALKLADMQTAANVVVEPKPFWLFLLRLQLFHQISLTITACADCTGERVAEDRRKNCHFYLKYCPRDN